MPSEGQTVWIQNRPDILSSLIWVQTICKGLISADGTSRQLQGCGNTLPDLSDLVPFHSGQVENFYLLVLGQVQMY